MLWILVFIATATFIYFALIKPFNYWSDRGVPQYKFWITWSDILLGFIPYRSISEGVEKVYNDFAGKRYCGIYQFSLPALFLRDPELIKQITVKDFDHFTDHFQIVPEGSEPLWEKNLFSLKGDKWREMRSTLSPSFTTSKMKLMFGLISDCAKQFIEYFQEKDLQVVTVEMKDAFTRFANDVIATTAFGLNCNSLKEPENEFYLMGKKITNFTSLLSNIKLMVMFAAPRFAKVLDLRFFGTNVTNFFTKIIKDNLETREKNGIVRPDMIHLLMEARKERSIVNIGEQGNVSKEKSRGKQLSDEDITAQALIFFFAGFDSVSTFMCFMAYELAVNPDIQERLQEEVDETSKHCNGTLTYEGLMKMKYMDMVVLETLRKWPAGVVVDRVCIKPYTIEPVEPGERSVHLQKGDVTWLPIFGLHRDPQYYPEPERFDPERFNDENKSNINPYTFIAFGSGPRSCIGNRFALMEAKLVFFYILQKFNITVVSKTTIPLKLAKSQVQFTAAGGFWLGLKQREKNSL